ncbi:MAG: copper-binding protein [Pseudomonadota bacterium]
MKKHIATLFAATAFISAPLFVVATEPTKHADQHSAKPASTASQPEMIKGEVKKVDRDAKKITLKHGDIKSMDMPGMTMVFLVKDAKMLENVKAGDKVIFSVEQTKSGYAVTHIEPAK